MSAVIPFESAKLPAYLREAGVGANSDLTTNVGAGFPVLSIKGKVFHIVRSGERTLVTKPDDVDEPATSLEVVLMKANPALAKVYYPSGYTEGSDAKPTCYSNDGIAPAADAEEAQSTSCKTCPHNQWGSKISENGSKVKACTDSRKMAIAPAGLLNDPMLLRVPAASLKPLAEYAKQLEKRGVPYNAVVTKIGFDHTEAAPKLTFKAVSFLTDEQFGEVQAQITGEVVQQIIGNTDFGPVVADAGDDVLPAGKPPAAAVAKPKPTPVEKAPAKSVEKPAAKAVAEEKEVKVATSSNLSAELDDILGDLDD